MKEKEPFCISVTNIHGITKKTGPKNAEVNDLARKPCSCHRKHEKFTTNVTPGPDHVISRGLRFTINVKLNVSIIIFQLAFLVFFFSPLPPLPLALVCLSSVTCYLHSRFSTNLPVQCDGGWGWG